MLITLKEVVVETQTKGKNRWQTATVAYEFNGEHRTQKMMSFSNPDVFKTIQEFQPDDKLDVTVTKNDQGYNQWAKVEKVSEAPAKAATAATGGTYKGSTYETPEERKIKQLYIIRQSSISNAISFLGQDVPVELILETAQKFVDFVYDNPFSERPSPTLEEMDSDVPY